MIRAFICSVVVSGLVLVNLVACDDSSDSGSGGNGTGNPSGSNASPICKGDTPQGNTTSCSDAELQTYASCVQSKCDASYKECFGAGYQQGNFSGPCASYVNCSRNCNCTDFSCISACPVEEACRDCLPKMTSCAQECPMPTCLTAGIPDGGGNTSGGCTELRACCDKMTDEQTKKACNDVQTAAGGNDTACGAYLTVYKSQCP